AQFRKLVQLLSGTQICSLPFGLLVLAERVPMMLGCATREKLSPFVLSRVDFQKCLPWFALPQSVTKI
ncbi:MAG TPA: hypothetical protein DCZ04_04910, partial [Syntrophorhabdus aromaticivorans]|nr:hypothetical protein [Syntrophorhabdus aromaticivorans]